ncbi:hypothetical protein GEV43_13165 [Actinomadura sp. J1-007]|nr:hypothetical protein [Actinomadura sp. J1-007]
MVTSEPLDVTSLISPSVMSYSSAGLAPPAAGAPPVALAGAVPPVPPAGAVPAGAVPAGVVPPVPPAGGVVDVAGASPEPVTGTPVNSPAVPGVIAVTFWTPAGSGGYSAAISRGAFGGNCSPAVAAIGR